MCNEHGVETLAHPATTLGPEYGTLVPMRYMNADQHFKVVSVSALCTVHYLNDSARLGWAMRKAVEDHYDGTVAFLASGSLEPPLRAERAGAGISRSRSGAPSSKRWTTRWWSSGSAATGRPSATMLPEYASKGHGEGFMHDTAMLLGVLGWSAYDGKAEVVTPYFGASGTGQINAVFPVTPQDGHAVPKAVASSGRRLLHGRDPALTATARPCPTSSSSTAATSTRATDMTALCRSLADTMLAQRDEAGKPVFPPGGTRVLAYPAPHFAISDGGAAGRAAGGDGDYGFAYLNLRMGRGRSAAVQQGVGEALMAVAKAHFAPLDGRDARRRDAADRRRRRSLRRQAQHAAPAVQQTGLTHAAARHHRPARPRALRRAQEPHARCATSRSASPR